MIKNCTSIEQSRKLLELGIDANTADMFWDTLFAKKPEAQVNNHHFIDEYDDEHRVPAWSLTALFKVIRNCNLGYLMQTTYDNNNVILTCEIGEKPYTIMTSEYDNEVDACVEMILRLHELNLL